MTKVKITKTAQFIVILILALGTMFVVGLLVKERPVHALPEYATRTGEPCGACHVNPGGGGPRTMSGLLWSANGNPDEMPAINIPIAPDVSDGQELYDIACASCHGLAGEGLFGPAVVGSGLQARRRWSCPRCPCSGRHHLNAGRADGASGAACPTGNSRLDSRDPTRPGRR